jgi:hypothetical protein
MRFVVGGQLAGVVGLPPDRELGDVGHKLTHALYMMAMVQVRRPSAGQAYYQRKHPRASRPRKPCAA